ncbi:hypothetical protein SDC9_107314 [bioreactor metagenome]|uniref:Uncharacterized protein n=1 Tax=bioreactor metagenome TaxID=1076179 RepID=A0A645BBB3_9ZZZZ
MFKKLILLFCILFLITPTAFAAIDSGVNPIVLNTNQKVIGIFLEAPMTYVNNETVRQLIPEKSKEKLPSHLFKILPYEQTETALRTYKEDNRMIINQYYSQPVNRADIQKICKELGAEYALFITVNNSAPRVGAGLFTTSFRTTVSCDVRLLNVETGKYVFNKQIVKDGSSTSFYAGVPSFERAYREALEKALDELTIDVTAL